MKKFRTSGTRIARSIAVTVFTISLCATGAAYAQGGMTGQPRQEQQGQGGMSGQSGSASGAQPTKPHEQGQGYEKKGMKKDTDMDRRGETKSRPGAGGSDSGMGTSSGSGSSSGGSSGSGGGGY